MNQLPEDSLRIYDVTLVTLYNLIGLATMLSSPRTSTPQILTPKYGAILRIDSVRTKGYFQNFETSITVTNNSTIFILCVNKNE